MNKIAYIIPFLFILYSCDDECPEPEQQESNAKYTLIAGEVINDSIVYYGFNPYITVKGSRIGVDTNYTYHDSIWIDIEENGSDDIYFEYYRYHFEPSCDCEGIDCCMPTDELYLFIKSDSHLEIASRNFYGGIMPKKFFLGDSIDGRYNWVTYKSKSAFSLAGASDEWSNDDFNSFLGIRILSVKDTLYGWVRINTHNLYNIEIYDCAIEK